MTQKEAKNIIEVLLFVSGTPLSSKKLGQILGIEPRIVSILIDQLQTEYETADKGIRIMEIAYGYQMVTQPDYAPWVEKLLKRQQEGKLSTSVLETLAIIAYNQPVTKAEIEKIRGVNSSGSIARLLEKKMIKITGRKEVAGRPLLYETTLEFLKNFGLPNLYSLPDFKELIEEELSAQ